MRDRPPLMQPQRSRFARGNRLVEHHDVRLKQRLFILLVRHGFPNELQSVQLRAGALAASSDSRSCTITQPDESPPSDDDIVIVATEISDGFNAWSLTQITSEISPAKAPKSTKFDLSILRLAALRPFGRVYLSIAEGLRTLLAGLMTPALRTLFHHRTMPGTVKLEQPGTENRAFLDQ